MENTPANELKEIQYYQTVYVIPLLINYDLSKCSCLKVIKKIRSKFGEYNSFRR